MLQRETLAAQAGTKPDPATGAITPPLHLATTFHRAPDGSYPGGFIYARDAAPTRSLFEASIAELEGGADACAFASGMAAANAIFQALAPGDRVVLPTDVYHGVRVLAADSFRRWGLHVDECDFSDSATWEDALKVEPRLIWLETPSNPQLRITDLDPLISAAKEVGAAVVVDGTWTTPLLQQPLELGADLVLHSVTKYIGGHSDVLGGIVVGVDPDSELFSNVRAIQKMAGAVMDPLSAWLSLRGIRSLAARLHRQCDSAERIASFLDAHPAVSRVHYPGLESHPGHIVAKRQMSRFGAMISIEHAGGETSALAVAARLGVFTRATSLGGTESLVEHRASIEPQPSPTPRSLLRLSVGLEHIDDLLADLEQALT